MPDCLFIQKEAELIVELIVRTLFVRKRGTGDRFTGVGILDRLVEQLP